MPFSLTPSWCRRRPDSLWIATIASAYALAAITLFFAIRSLQAPRLDIHQLVDVVRASTTVRQEIVRGGLRFPFVFVESPGTPITLFLALGAPSARGPCTLWLYTSQASNHCELDVFHEGTCIGTVDNRNARVTGVPQLALSRVGNIVSDGDPLDLTITARADGDRFFAELGIIIVAPQTLSESAVMEALTGTGAGASGDFFGAAALVGTILLAAAFFIPSISAIPVGNARAVRLLFPLALISVCHVFCLWHRPAAPLLPPYGRHNSRSGIESLVDSATAQGLLAVRSVSLTQLPDRQVLDDVSGSTVKDHGVLSSLVFVSPQYAPHEAVYNGLLGGHVASVQQLDRDTFLRTASLLAIFTFLSIAFAGAYPTRATIAVALIALVVLSVFFSMRASEGWDEFFINLRHADMLLRHGVYSVNAAEMVEATVDLLPLMLTAFLGLFGLPLADAFLASSLLGNALIVPLTYVIVRHFTNDRFWSLVVAGGIAIHPNVVAVGTTGFSAVLFTAWLLAAGFFFFVFRDSRLGTALLATVTLARVEGILFAMLVTLSRSLETAWKACLSGRLFYAPLVKEFRVAVTVAVPFLLSLLVRHFTYGSAIPTPVIFKNTSGDRFYASAGIDRFLQMLSSNDLHIAAVLIALCGIVAYGLRDAPHARIAPPSLRPLYWIWGLLFLFVLPYYLGGGDWFPPRWNRYGMPFAIASVLLLAVVFHRVIFSAFVGAARYVALYASLAALAVGYFQSMHVRSDNALAETVTSVVTSPTGRWNRIDDLASLGVFLRQALPPEAVIACPEEATVMYYAKREMLGLLGISNPEISQMPLQPMRPGDIMHRRRGVTSVHHRRPDILLLWEPFVTVQLNAGPDFMPTLRTALQQKCFTRDMCTVAYYRVGSFQSLESLGYRHLTLCFADKVYSLFVHDNLLPLFVADLARADFVEMGTLELSYTLDSVVAGRYSQSAPFHGGGNGG